jgi:hypothetical protein
MIGRMLRIELWEKTSILKVKRRAREEALGGRRTISVCL